MTHLRTIPTRLLAALLTTILLSACTSDTPSEQTTYYCPMHPQVVADEPSICPICNMDLVPEGDPDAMAEHLDGESDELLRLGERGRIIANVATVEAAHRQLSSDITAPAVVEIDEAGERSIAARIPGRIDRLYVDRIGASIRKGQAIGEIYSPELLAAQKEYLIALDTRERDLLPRLGSGEDARDEPAVRQEDRLVSASAERLRLLGMSNRQIEKLAATKKVAPTTTIFANASGVVTRKGVREGEYVAEGTLLFDVVDLSSVRVVASVPEAEAARLRVGMEMLLTGPTLGTDRVVGRIDYIYPIVDPETRTIQVRAIVPNRNNRLRPGSYLSASIILSARDPLTVPASAVVRTGRRNLVWVEVDENLFEPREIEVGMTSGGYIEVLAGDLVEGEAVVAEGGYLLDSERTLSMPIDSDAGATTGSSGGHKH